MRIFLVYAFILKVKNNIKPQNEQNLFPTGGGLPLPYLLLLFGIFREDMLLKQFYFYSLGKYFACWINGME